MPVSVDVTDATLSFSDVTTNDVSTTKHGFVPKGTNAGNFLKDDGTWAAAGGLSSSAGTDNAYGGPGAGNALVAGSLDNTLLGDDAGLLVSTGDNNTCVGSGAGAAITTSSDKTCIGKDAGVLSTGVGGVYIGSGSGAAVTTGVQSVIIGKGAGAALTTQSNDVFIGENAGYGATCERGVAIGDNSLATTSGIGNIAIGMRAGQTIETGTYNTCIGYYADSVAASNFSIVLGASAAATASSQFVVGSSGRQVTDYYFGEGVTNATPLAITFQPTGGSGTNIAGANYNIAGGKATGNAAGGSILLQTSDAGVSGAALQALTTKVTVFASGGVNCGSPTGGDKGAGTLNAVGVYDDNVLLTDYVFDKYFDGQVGEPDIGRHGDYRMMSIGEMSDFVEENRHLPTMVGREEWEKDGSASLGELVTQLWETVEVQALYIRELSDRIDKLSEHHGQPPPGLRQEPDGLPGRADQPA